MTLYNLETHSNGSQMAVPPIQWCCTAMHLAAFPYDFFPPQDSLRPEYNAPKRMSEFFQSPEWKRRSSNRSVIAYLPIREDWDRRRKALEDRGWVCIHQYMSDTAHMYKGNRYKVGIYFLDAKDNMTTEQIALSEAP